MYELAIHRDAEIDLECLWETDEIAAADISVLLEEIRDDQELLAAMAIHQRSEGRIQISKLLNWQPWGWDVWRLRVYALEPQHGLLSYRVIYAQDRARHIFYVLGIMSRDIGYERDGKYKERIKRAYKELGIPKLTHLDN